MYTEHRPPRIRALVCFCASPARNRLRPGCTARQRPKLLHSEASASSVATISFTQEPDSLNPLYTTMWFSGILTDIYLVGL